MMTRRTLAFAFAMALTPIIGVGQALAAGTTVNVLLTDKGQMADDAMGMIDKMTPEMHMGMGMKGGMAGLGMGPMAVEVDATEIKAGEVTFNVKNGSAGMIHEMIVAQISSPDTPLPYLADEYRVDEEKAGHLGEVAELDPGKSGALTVTLSPGTYILYCNIPGHYALGMWTLLTVAE